MLLHTTELEEAAQIFKSCVVLFGCSVKSVNFEEHYERLRNVECNSDIYTAIKQERLDNGLHDMEQIDDSIRDKPMRE